MMGNKMYIYSVCVTGLFSGYRKWEVINETPKTYVLRTTNVPPPFSSDHFDIQIRKSVMSWKNIHFFHSEIEAIDFRISFLKEKVCLMQKTIKEYEKTIEIVNEQNCKDMLELTEGLQKDFEAALEDLKRHADCTVCLHFNKDSIDEPCKVGGCFKDGRGDKWQWRGRQEGEKKC